MATFLSLSNELLREMNEVELASGSFATATGIQQHVKDAINRAYLDIVNQLNVKNPSVFDFVILSIHYN